VRCSALQCVAVGCTAIFAYGAHSCHTYYRSVLQCVAVCCSALQLVALRYVHTVHIHVTHITAVCCSALQCVVVRCSWLHCDMCIRCTFMSHILPQCVAVCCSALQCVAVCCSVLQCVAMRCVRAVHIHVARITFFFLLKCIFVRFSHSSYGVAMISRLL